MPTRAQYQKIIYDAIKDNFAETVQIYKFASETVVAPYGQGITNYAAGSVSVECVFVQELDADMQTLIGRLNEDEAALTIAVDELEAKFPAASEREWLDVKDGVVARNTKYSITGVRHFGSIKGGPNVVFVKLREKPDLNV